MRAPIKYFGGKGHLVKKLVPLIPPHKYYCEVFGGSGALLFAKPPSSLETYNDLDGNLVNLFLVLQNKRQFKQFLRLVQLTPYSREIYKMFVKQLPCETNPIRKAHKYWFLAATSFGGMIERKSIGMVVTSSKRGMAQTCSAFLSRIALLPEIHKRIIKVQIEHQDFRDLIPMYDTPDTFFYVDPPYIASTRKAGGYAHEMTDSDHTDLVNILLNIKGQAILSGYKSALYQPLVDANWQYQEFQVVCSAAGCTRNRKLQGKGTATKHQPRTESIYYKFNMSYKIQTNIFVP